MSTPPRADRAQGRKAEPGHVAPPLERLDEKAAIPRYQLDEWQRAYGVVAGVTGRDGDFDLGLWSGKSTGVAMSRWRAFREAMGVDFPSIVVSHQHHGAVIGDVAGAATGLLLREGLDGHCTNLPGVLLTVTVADCVPVYLLHPATGTLALLHAGWRGVVAGIVSRGIERVCEVAGAPVSDIVMHCGVSICGDCYEVGPEVLTAVTGRPAGGAGALDLRAAVRDRAEQQGVTSVSVSCWCTAHHAERFFSHRRSGGADGRMLAYLGRAASGPSAVGST